MPPAILDLKNVSKRFPGVVALDKVSIGIERGEIHALLGENGAGKSTIVNLIGGVLAADEGEIVFDGAAARFRDPRDSVRHGIAIIHQEPALLPSLSVAENVMIDHLPRRLGGLVDWPKLRRQAGEVLERVGLALDPDEPVERLATGARQQVEIAHAVAANPKLLVMDEPTSALTEQEVERIFEVIRNLRGDGLSVIFISHRFDEVWELSERLTVLRDGQVVFTRPAAETSHAEAAEAMVGRTISTAARRSRRKPGEEVLAVRGLVSDRLAGVDLRLRAGEVVGVGGALGAGKSELLRALFGVDDTVTGGEADIAGQPARIDSARAAMRHGIFFVPEDRKREGLVLSMSVADNITLPYLHAFSRGGLLSTRAQTSFADRFVERLRIKTPSARQRTINLSGGNQQKAVLARWLSLEPRVLLLDEPTRGLDVGAKEEVYELIAELAGNGVGILFVATEVPELLRICDRIYVMRDGRVAREFDADRCSEQQIVLASHGDVQEAAA
ncbi:MAG TPA: sugar ABC transporter ATP-binding protein [Actinomycetes bacterium]|nr:sugar ABC transporter ATP-binding protein [Actinomycetes bacterium]